MAFESISETTIDGISVEGKSAVQIKSSVVDLGVSERKSSFPKEETLLSSTVKSKTKKATKENKNIGVRELCIFLNKHYLILSFSFNPKMKVQMIL